MRGVRWGKEMLWRSGGTDLHQTFLYVLDPFSQGTNNTAGLDQPLLSSSCGERFSGSGVDLAFAEAHKRGKLAGPPTASIACAATTDTSSAHDHGGLITFVDNVEDQPLFEETVQPATKHFC